jgi:hypothetical protein
MVRLMSRSRSDSIMSVKADVKATELMQPKNLSERWFANVFGVKGSSLSPNQEFEENPMARLKLLMVREIHICKPHVPDQIWMV